MTESPSKTPSPPSISAEATGPGAPAEKRAALGPLCTLAERNYQDILAQIQIMHGAEKILQNFHARRDGVTEQNLAQAKEQFHRAKQSYLKLGNQINDGIRQVQLVAKAYLEDLVVQTVYQTYLAKLLASLETRHPIQHFIRLLAAAPFPAETHPPTKNTPPKQQEDQPPTLEHIKNNIIMLETRYQKRLLSNRLRQGTPPEEILPQLEICRRQDPLDINTPIWIASLLSEQIAQEKDPQQHPALQDKILTHCKHAFLRLDDYLNLQGVETPQERKRLRHEYMQTIGKLRQAL